ncbi:hypothetical protein [Clostridium sp. AF34-13]|uniref:hypothetical protein n=1 Tax=Clostridium sp. AF34-13 TaxID=2293012 RepID=UPI0011C23104|nr:hypothetical protein [Clostridium sp. AF34-13]
MYNRSMKSSIAAFKYGARKEYGRYYAAELAKKHESWIKKQGHRHLYRFLYIKRDIKKEAIIRQRSLQII